VRAVAIVIAALAALALAAVALNRLGLMRLRNRAHRAAAREGSFAGGRAVSVTDDLIVLAPLGGATDGPAVLLVHAWGVPDPAAYRGLIEHLLKRGMVVRFPLYQRRFTPHPITRRLRAILDRGAPEWRQDTILAVGHSAGATGLLDLVVAEHGNTALRHVFLASPGDGTDAEGKAASTSLALLKWGGAPAPSAQPAPPAFTLISSDGDALTGHATADRMNEYLRTIGWGGSARRVRLPVGDGCGTHFWPLGGDPTYRLSPVTRAFAKTDALGGGASWECDAVDWAFWAMIDDAAHDDAARVPPSMAQ